ncbi:MAG: hypothetical protein ACKO0M_14025 [Cyanobium sp.]
MEHSDRDSGVLGPVGPEARIPSEDPAEAMANARGRSPRHVLMPSEPVEVEILHQLPERRRLLQADLLTLSAGGCCFVVFHRIELSGGEEGVIRRLAPEAAGEPSRRFRVRWVQDLGPMLAIGGQYLEA